MSLLVNQVDHGYIPDLVEYSAAMTSAPTVQARSLRGKPSTKLLLGTFFVAAMLVALAAAHAYAVDPPAITVATPSFGSGAAVTVAGSGFKSDSSVKVWLDLNANGKLDSGEPYVLATTDSSGGFSAVLDVGSVPVGSYSMDAGSGNMADASVPVSVVDPSVLTAITNAASNVESHFDGSLATAISSVNSGVSSVQSELDSKLSSILGIDNQILSYLNGGVPQEFRGGGVCILDSSSEDAGCDISLGDVGQVPVNGVTTLTLWIASCSSTPPCTPNTIEAGGQVSVTLTIVDSHSHIHTDTYQWLYSCTYGTCNGQDIKTLTFTAANFQIHGGCYKGAYGTNSCSDNIEVFYSYSALEAP